MTPNAITLLFREARDAFPPLEGKPTDNNLLSIRETLLPILMEIPYNQLGGVHSLTAIITDGVRYAADHGGNAFKRPVRLGLYDEALQTMPPRSFAFARRRPTKLASTTTPVSRRPNAGPLKKSSIDGNRYLDYL